MDPMRNTTANNIFPTAEAVQDPRLSNNTFNASVLNESSLDGKSLQDVHKDYFSINQKYADRNALVEFCKIVGCQYNFYTCLEGDGKIWCSQGPKRKHRGNGIQLNPPQSIKINCPWEIRFSSIIKRQTNTKKRNDFSDGNVIYIRSSHAIHTCDPDPNKRLWIIARNGDLFKDYLTPSAMFLLSHHLQDLPKTCFRTLRNILSKMFPSSIVWTGWRICNVRKFILGKIKHMENNNSGHDFVEFQKQFSKPEFIHDLNKAVTDEDTNREMAYDIWKESINCDDGSGSNLVVQMKCMKTSIPGFDYRFAKNSMSEILGVVWQTDIMRGNIHRAPENLSLDMRHAKTNHLLWPYVSCVFRDTDMKILLGVEGFVCRESIDLYKHMVDSLFDMSPLAKREDVLVVHGDGRLDQRIVTDELGLPNARFVEDHWHIINTKFPKDYGIIYNNNPSTFNELLQTRSDEHYQQIVDAIKVLLSGNRSLLDLFDEFILRKQYHAKHIVTMYPGSFGKVSSTPSEQNHASIQSWQGKYYACIVSSIHNLFMRHLHRVALTCSQLISDELKLSGIKALLNQDNLSLLLAAELLNIAGYTLFANELSKARNYETVPVEGDLTKSLIRHMDHPESTGRYISHETGHCEVCEVAVAYRFFYCRHTIAFIVSNNAGVTFLNIRIEKLNIARRYWMQPSVLRLKTRRDEVEEINTNITGERNINRGTGISLVTGTSTIGDVVTGTSMIGCVATLGTQNYVGNETRPSMHATNELTVVQNNVNMSSVGNMQVRREVPLHHDIKEVTERICELTMKQDDDMKLYISGMLRSLERILYTGQEPQYEIATIQQVHDLHTKFATGLNDSVNLRVGTSITHPSTSLQKKQSLSRLQSKREQYLGRTTAKRVREEQNSNLEPVTLVANTQPVPKCKICGMPGHRQKNCQIHESYFPLIEEKNVIEFTRYLLHESPLSKESVSRLTESVYKGKYKQCIQVLTVHTKGDLIGNVSHGESQLAFKVNVMEPRNQYKRVYENIFITFNELNKFVSNMNKSTSRFVYSKVKELSVGNQFVLRVQRNDLIATNTNIDHPYNAPTTMASNYNMIHTNARITNDNHILIHNNNGIELSAGARQFVHSPVWPNPMGYNNQFIGNNGRAADFNVMNGSYPGFHNMTNYHNLDRMETVRNQYGLVHATLNRPVYNRHEHVEDSDNLEEDEI